MKRTAAITLLFFLCELQIFAENLTKELTLKSVDTDVAIGGRIELNAQFNSPEGSFLSGSIPLKSQNGSNNFDMNARSSRIWVKTRTPTRHGLMLTTVEIDFLGNDDSSIYAPRLRHAYAELAGFGFGYTNSAFNSIVAIETIMFPMDDAFVRQPTLRYTHDSENISYDVSLESADTTAFETYDATSATSTDRNSAPDIIARARYYQSWGEVAVAYLSRLITQEDSKNTKYAWGTNLSGRVETFGFDDIRFNAHYGVGSGRYIGYNAFGAGVVNQNTKKIDLTTAFGGHLGYRHWWSSSFRSTFALSYLASKIDAAHQNSFEFLTKKSQALQMNLYWNPMKNVLVGAEYAHAKREVYSGDSGELKSANLVFRYDF